MDGVGTSIIGRPRPLSRHRRADDLYTLNCEEPAKAIALGADVVAIARPLLAAAIDSAAAVADWLQGFIDELRICLHGSGAPDLAAMHAIRLVDR
nr:isopentenyl pyrophosphate isomerase [Mycolicibacterium smegmatis]